MDRPHNGPTVADWPRQFDCIAQLARGEVAGFAARELGAYLHQGGGREVRIVRQRQPVDRRFRVVVMQVDPSLPAAPAQGETDRFRVRYEPSEHAVFLEGVNPRSLLFAVYAFLRDVLGWRFYHAEEAFMAPAHRAPRTCVLMYQCGFAAMEYLFKPDMGIAFLDFMTRSLFNGVLIRLADIQGHQDWFTALLPEITRRGLNVTVGGHAIPHLLAADTYFDEHPEWFAEVDGSRRGDSGHICFSNAVGRAAFLDNAVAWVIKLKERCRSITRFTIWPEDSGDICTCAQCREQRFVDHYSGLIGELAERVRDAAVPVRVEYILYNANNAPGKKKCLDMMVPPERPVHADALVAYWGRTYAVGWERSDYNRDAAAWKLIEKTSEVCKQTGTNVRLYEYYIDHWMQSPLYAPLWDVIRSDLRLFRKQGVSGLILDTSTFGFPKQGYPDLWLKELNAFVIGDEAWDAPTERTPAAYVEDCYGDQAALAGSILRTLSQVLPPVTQFNLFHPFPGLAGQLLWHRKGRIAWHTFDPSDRSAEAGAVHAARKAVFAKAEQALCSLELPGDPATGEMRTLCAHVRFCRKRLHSIGLQLRAQDEIMAGTPDAADALIEAALEQDPFADAQRKEIDAWRLVTGSK